MWDGYENALKQYLNECIDEWVSRGYNNNMKHEVIDGDTNTENKTNPMPKRCDEECKKKQAEEQQKQRLIIIFQT